MLSPTTILLVDDSGPFRAAVAALLRAEKTFEVIGEAGDGQTGVALAAKLRPDIVLMDVEMPGSIDGIEATRQVCAGWEGHGGVVLALSSSFGSEQAMLDAGAAGFVPKEEAIKIVSRIQAALTR